MSPVAALATLLLMLPWTVAGQQSAEQCTQTVSGDVAAYCLDLVDAVSIMQARTGLAATGGNPVPGTASTLGMRIGSTPRFSFGLRTTGTRPALPPLQITGGSDTNAWIGSASADLSVGVLPGFNLLPTVGGFASLDVLASAGLVGAGAGFDARPFTWSVGARVGILRESFTAPGISVSGMYRRLGDMTYDDSGARLTLDGQQVLSVRGTIGKRVLGLGLTGGAGYDRYSADVTGAARSASVTVAQFDERDMTQSRKSAFANVSFTMLILNLAAEVGWQDGGESVGPSDMADGGVFGSLAIRLAL